MTSWKMESFCAVCVFVGYILPWSLLAIATGISLLGMSVNMTPAWGATAAYLTAVSLIVFALSAVFQRIKNSLLD